MTIQIHQSKGYEKQTDSMIMFMFEVFFFNLDQSVLFGETFRLSLLEYYETTAGVVKVSWHVMHIL